MHTIVITNRQIYQILLKENNAKARQYYNIFMRVYFAVFGNTFVH